MPDTAKELEFNLVVVGGGGAGLAAAAAAAENGLKNIAVIEKHGACGGSSAMASGIFAADSPAQKRQVIIAHKDDLFKRQMAWAHQSVEARIMRAFVDKSADTIRWFESKGLFFKCVSHSPIDNPMTWHVPGGEGIAMIKALLNDCKNMGVEIFLNTSLKKILKDRRGNVTGVVAGNKDGDTTFKARAVVIATGGFAGDRELLKKYAPRFRDNMMLAGAPNMGEGIFQSLEAGAAADGLGMLMVAGPFGIGPRVLNLGKEPNNARIQMICITGEPTAVWLNKEGRRFADETISFNYYEGINAIIRQTDGMCYAIFDAAHLRRITETGLSNVCESKGLGQKERSPLPEGMEQEFKKYADKGEMVISDSWDDVADWMGMDRKTLNETVSEYNESCNKGHDHLFAKDRIYLKPLDTPPYYGVRCGSSYLNTLGGIRINEKMEVLDKSGNVIKGLYVAGVDAGGWTSETYCAALPGTAFGWAVNSGRIAGESAGDYVKEK